MNNKKIKDNSLLGGVTFSLSAIVPLIIALMFSVAMQIIFKGDIESAQQKNFYIFASFLISQLAFFIIIVVLNLFFDLQINYKKTHLSFYAIAFLAVFGLFFGFGQLNVLFVSILEKLGLTVRQVILPNVDKAHNFILALIIIAILPAIFEEVLFRGIILNALKKYGSVFAVVVSAALFSLFHQNPVQTVYQFISGLVFAFVALKAGSILPTMFMHFINNAYILFAYKYNFTLGDTQSLIFMVAGILVSIVCGVLLFIKKQQKNQLLDENAGKNFFLYALPGIVLCLVSWIAGLFYA